MRGEVYPAVTPLCLPNRKMGRGGAVLKGGVTCQYLSDARVSPSTSYGDIGGRGEVKGGVAWWFAQ